MMFTRATAIILAALPALAVATPALVGRGNGGSGSSCSTGNMQCCNSVQNATAPGVASLAGLLGIVLGPLTGEVGIQCSPISVVGVLNGNSCSAHAVCCDNNNVGGLISTGCIPLSL